MKGLEGTSLVSCRVWENRLEDVLMEKTPLN